MTSPSRAGDPARRSGRFVPVDVFAAARLLWGAGLLAAPGPLRGAFGVGPGDASAVTFGRVLGARHLVQAAVTAARPTVGVLVAGVIVDALHTASLLVIAAAAPQRRRPALTDAADASAWCLLGVAAVASVRAHPADAER